MTKVSLLKKRNRLFSRYLTVSVAIMGFSIISAYAANSGVATTTPVANTPLSNTASVAQNQVLALVQSSSSNNASSNSTNDNSSSVAATGSANTNTMPINANVAVSDNNTVSQQSPVTSENGDQAGGMGTATNNNSMATTQGESDNLTDNSDVQHVSTTGLDPGLFPTPNDTEKQAFNAVTQQMMPMTPAQIKRLRDMLDITQRAEAALPGVPPRSVIRTVVVNLAPGSLPPPINLSQGFVSSLVFTDSTGSNWPVESFDLGNPKEFNIQWQKGSNILMVQASGYQPTNLAVTLQGLSTPVILTLTPGQQVVDYRDDLQIPGNGPNAAPVIQTGLPAPASNVLLGVLDGVAPAGAKVLQVQGGNAQAWLVNNTLYVRTMLTVLSPSWISVMTSSDGTKAYQMPETPSILVSEYGRPIELQIEGF